MADEWMRLQNEDDDGEEEDNGEEEPRGYGRPPWEGRLMERMLRTRTILVCEPITDRLARRVYQSLLLMEEDDPEKPITIVVNSPGGEADSGFGIMDMIRFVGSPVRILVAGLCASAGVLVALAAPKEQRFSLPHSRFLLHQPMTTTYGQASDLEIASTEILRLRDSYNRIVAQETGKSMEQVTEDTDRDFWMVPEQALEYGLISAIVRHRKEIDKR